MHVCLRLVQILPQNSDLVAKSGRSRIVHREETFDRFVWTRLDMFWEKLTLLAPWTPVIGMHARDLHFGASGGMSG